MSGKPLEKKKAKITAYHRIFNTDDGRAVLKDMMNVHFIFSSTFSKNPGEKDMNEGERNVVLRLMKILNISPEEMKNLSEEIERDAKSNTTESGSDYGRSRIGW